MLTMTSGMCPSVADIHRRELQVPSATSVGVGILREESSMAGTEENDTFEKMFEAVPDLPRRVITTYGRLWQFETWLRQMIYVELRAAFGNNWYQQIAKQPTHALTADQRLTHMPSPEQHPLSFITFGDLRKTIDKHWRLFVHYLPPQDIWNAKLEEVSQIRNRVAHFRFGHQDDLDRVLQLIRDVDQGFWKFCASYNNAAPVLPATADPVVSRFRSLDQFPYSKVGKRKWARVGIADPDATINVTINVLRRPWQTIRARERVAGEDGFLYDVIIAGRQRRIFDYPQYLKDTKFLHGDLAHICLESFCSEVRVTIPTILGTRAVNKIIQALIDWLPNSLRSSSESGDRTEEVQRLAEEWPEYVLGPSNPLSFLTPEMPCSFFTV